VVIPDSFMHKVYNKDPEALKKWSIILKTRMEKGQPYIMYEDNVNRKNPKSYEKFGEKVSFTNICTEITLATKPGESSFVCCLSSLNFALYDIWSKINQPFSIPQLAVLLLDSVLEEFIEKTEKASESSYDKRELNRARKNAIESRAIGIGVLGYHTYLQRKMIPIDSLYARNVRYNALKYIQDEANTMSKLLGQMISVPKLADNRRHSHLTAIAPTVTNAHISGGVSPSIEPWPSNYYTLKTAKGTFFKKNEELDAYLKSLNLGEEQYKTLWDIIKKDEGSVVNVPEKIIPKEIKDVFKTFQEVNQLALVEHTAFCVDLVDQATSLNLCFSPNEKASTVSLVHKTAWQMGVKTLYYLRTGSAIRGDNLHNNGCSSCEA
jgi:ribonucleoside-diphosphate reductase alpha chain